MPTSPYWLLVTKDAMAAAQSVATIVALIAAAVWFFTRRQRFPRANVEHQVTHWRVGDSAVVRLTIRVSNIGIVLIEPIEIRSWIQQLEPPPDEFIASILNQKDPGNAGESELPWPMVGSERLCDWSSDPREIEPGEIDAHHFDFVVPPEVQSVALYSYVRNAKKTKRDIGWNTTTVYFLSQEKRAMPKIESVYIPLPGGAQGPAKQHPPKKEK